MKNVISITEARKKLPSLIKSLKSSPDTVYQITFHDEIVAEIRTPPKIKPGEAAARLLELRKRLGSKKYNTNLHTPLHPSQEGIKKDSGQA
jgi:hypothetical protein